MRQRDLAVRTVGLTVMLVLTGACGPTPGSVDDPGAGPGPAPSVAPAAPRVLETPGMPIEFTNLQFLPSDISTGELKERMKLVTRSLGTKCDHCHRTDVGDFASDEIRDKIVARDMMRMVEQINRDLFTWENAPEATCFMCHRGQHEPQMEPGGGPSTAGAKEDS